ncbi:hypothetical protein TNCT_19651 [Trichonephila clavata]|uniref:Uncharacterized protein n=1 Tax=Trichonephila clavata TaxID=2740835 RepID=A0A8X6F7Y7_TRICU|nr:hypothetical protein TNCT_19651 [Trichonephila clavata]
MSFIAGGEWSGASQCNWTPRVGIQHTESESDFKCIISPRQTHLSPKIGSEILFRLRHSVSSQSKICQLLVPILLKSFQIVSSNEVLETSKGADRKGKDYRRD